MCWFDSGHSDSNDPASFQHAMVQEATEQDALGTPSDVPGQNEGEEPDKSSGAPSGDTPAAAWAYIRVPCLGFLPGLCCPHFDKVQVSVVM